MSRNFVTASSQSLSNGAAVLSAYPMTLACWFKTATIHTGALVALDNGIALYNAIRYGSGTVDAFSSGAFISSSTNTVGTGIWSHAAGVFSAANSRTAYLNGQAGTTDVNLNVAGLGNTTNIGEVISSEFFNGDIAHAAIWNVALTTAEILSLYNGLSPLLIRSSALSAYWILAGAASPEPDYFNNFNLTLNNAPIQGTTDPSIVYDLEFTKAYPNRLQDNKRIETIGY